MIDPAAIAIAIVSGWWRDRQASTNRNEHSPALLSVVAAVRPSGRWNRPGRVGSIEAHRRAAWQADRERLLCRLAPLVTMVESTKARQRNHSGAGGRLWLDRSSIRGVLVQGIVNPILFVIADVIAD